MSMRYKIFITCFIFFVVVNAEASVYYNPTSIGTLTPPPTNGITYYVDSITGSDAYTRTQAQNISTPWKTIQKAFYNYSDYNSAGSGVRVLVRAGTYKERVTLAASWTNGTSYETGIILAAYGDGQVIIDASTTNLGSWTAHDLNIFKSTWSDSATLPRAVVINDDFKSFHIKQSVEQLLSYGDWYYDSSALVLYVHTDGVDPSTQNVIVTENNSGMSLERYCIKTGGEPYVTISGLTLKGAAKYAVSDYISGGRANHTKVEYCSFRFCNSTGIRLFGDYSEIRNCESYGNMLFNWPRGRTYGSTGSWGQGITISNHGIASGNYSHDNGGEGIGVYGGDGYTTFENNISANNYSVGLYLDNAPYCTFRNNLVYAAEPDPLDEVESWMVPSGSTIESIYGRMRQYGINIGDETATNATARGIGHKVYNNIIIGCREGFGTYGQATGSGLKNYEIVGNTIIMPTEVSGYGNFYGIRIDSDNVNNTGSVIKNNIVVGSVDEPLVKADSGPWVGVEMGNNVFYNPNDSTSFMTGAYPSEIEYSFSDWKTGTAQDATSSFSDPSLGDLSWTPERQTEIYNLLSLDVRLYAPSILTQNGVVTATYLDDFNSDHRSSYTTGAIEYGAFGNPGTYDLPTVNAGSAQTVYAATAELDGTYTIDSGLTATAIWEHGSYSGFCTLIGGALSGTVTNLSIGLNTIMVTVTDSEGQEDSDTVIITREMLPEVSGRITSTAVSHGVVRH